jgi:hypothetical protein
MSLAFRSQLFDEVGRAVRPISPDEAARYVVRFHYLHRRPPISHAFGLVDDGSLRGVCTFGVPASRHLQVGVCPSDPGRVLELNRLWCADELPRNTESWFVTRCLAEMPPSIVVSYADTAQGHVGYIYRALGWRYAGWTDMDRKTPRLDYIPTSGGHTRDAMRSGIAEKVRRKPKVRYWTTTGNRTERKRLALVCAWPSLDWRTSPPPAAVYVGENP